jgi:hypothetical protein
VAAEKKAAAPAAPRARTGDGRFAKDRRPQVVINVDIKVEAKDFSPYKVAEYVRQVWIQMQKAIEESGNGR